MIRPLMALAVLALAACAPALAPLGPGGSAALTSPEPGAAALKDDRFITRDGLALGLTTWLPEGEPQAVFVALHGMNDYANTFAMPAPWWAGAHAIATYALDQRGHGRSPLPGRWAGGDAMVDDAAALIAAVQARHPQVPVYLLGVSMGGAVAITALAERTPDVAGAILVAPAVWGWSVLPFHYRATLWTMARIAPWASFTGSGLAIWPSDNIDMLRALAADPLVVKETRTDAIYGLVDLMDRAYRAAGGVERPVLLLYGAKDEIIPRRPIEDSARAMCAAPLRLAVYDDGYHMLLRDRQAPVVWADIAAFAADPGGALPSKAERPIPARTAPSTDGSTAPVPFSCPPRAR